MPAGPTIQMTAPSASTYQPSAMPMMTMPAPTLTTSAEDKEQKELINYLQKRSADLPPDIQQRVHNASRKQGKRVNKDLESAAKQFGEARTQYEEALLARSQHISNWKTFLAEAVKNWSEYGKLFEQHEAALKERIATAKEQFQEAKESLDASKNSAGTVTIEEISDEEELPADVAESAMQITESIQSLSNSLQQLSKETESIKVDGPTAKRPRTEETPGAVGKPPCS